ncbi:tetratricopeptide repeat protein [Desulfovibrio inopinatus]|uniref:tetratricopeptide repeat protein n=1 Tax=Desulfovibrio inopinatus TaxID=102109 RepID=UPI000423BB8F|nr:tetratricopeptide repeat protein [Desulfovibrio inopinatus]
MTSGARKVLEGKDDFLFLYNDTNNVIEQITGKTSLPQTLQEQWKREQDRRFDYCKQYNAKYILFIIPNKHCVYNEYLPENIVLSEDRTATRIQNVANHVFYPNKIISRFKENHLLYYKNDSHWTELGLTHSWNALSSLLELDLQLDTSNIIKENGFIGDLGNKFSPHRISSSERLAIPSHVTETWKNGFENRGNIRIFTNTNTELKTCILFGDSFSNMHLHRIAEYFSKLYFFHTNLFSEEEIQKLQPDVVINCNVERFFWAPPQPCRSVFFYEFLDYVEAGKYDSDAFRFFLNTKYNSVYPRYIYTRMKELCIDHIRLQDKNQNPKIFFSLHSVDMSHEDIPTDSSIDKYTMSFQCFKKYTKLKEKKDTNDAILFLKKATELYPEGHNYFYQLSLEYDRQGMFYESLIHAQKSVVLQENKTEYLHHLGNILFKMGCYKESYIYQERAVEMNPESHGALYQLSRLHTIEKRYAEALKAIKKAIEFKQDNPYYYGQLGDTLLNTDNPAAAIEAYRQVIKRNPNITTTYAQLALAHERCNQLDKAIIHIKKALELAPQNTTYQKTHERLKDNG